jgi:glyceraldehyde 3-phosphate dehydrogenase
MKRIVINGFGRIGRLAFRLLIESDEYEIVAINSHGTPETLAYLLKYDTMQGPFAEDLITFNDEGIIFADKLVKTFAIDDPKQFPWKELNVDCVLECTGAYTKYEDAIKHIEAGAKHVIISAPGKGDMKTIVYGVNDKILDGNEKIVSAASCTTNCLAPVLSLIDKTMGIESGFMTTIHALTNDQNTLDGNHKKGITSRRGRAAAFNIVPASTGAASAIGEVLPNLKGKLDGIAFRVPVADGSCIDLSITLKRETSIEEVNSLFKNNQNDVLKYTEDPIVSSDIIGTTYGSVVDGLQTKVLDYNKKTIKVVAWYDNEYGYTSQMLRAMVALLNKR